MASRHKGRGAACGISCPENPIAAKPPRSCPGTAASGDNMGNGEPRFATHPGRCVTCLVYHR